jgi:hypothetical protein
MMGNGATATFNQSIAMGYWGTGAGATAIAMEWGKRNGATAFPLQSIVWMWGVWGAGMGVGVLFLVFYSKH